MNVRAMMVGVVVSVCVAAGAEPPASPAKPAPAKPKPAPAPPAVAILDYEITVPGNKDLGSQMADILTARLSIEDSIQLVERAKLGKIIEEQKLKLIGIVDQDKAVKVGKLVGARLMVMGKGFLMDKKLMLVTKIVGVETGLVKGTIRTVAMDKPMSEAILLLAEDIAAVIRKNGAKLLPKGERLADPVAAIRKKLGKAPTVTIAVIIPEEHKASRPAPPLADPAVETEIKRMLLACGFKVVDVGQNALADWARAMFKAGGKPWPAALKNADVIVVGEGLSEFALRTGELVSCVARAEVNVIDRHTGQVLKALRQTQRAVDLAEGIAGKTALQKAGHKLGLAVAESLVAYEKKRAEKAAPAKAPQEKGPGKK